MISRDEQRARVVDRLSAHLLETGLGQTSLRQLAAAAGVSDRMLLYYFADKAEVLANVLAHLAGGMADTLAKAIPDTPALPPAEFIAHASALMIQPDMRRFMRLWIELVAAAARNEAPFVAIAAQITAGFLGWIDTRLALPAGADRQAACAAIFALIDGLALVDICSGGDVAGGAAKAMQVLLKGASD